MSFFKDIEILKLKNGEMNLELDRVVIEKSLRIFIDDIEYIVILMSPENVHEFLVGFLFVEGIVDKVSDIKSIKIDEESAYIELKKENKINKNFFARVLGSSCGKGSMIYNEELELKGNISDGINNMKKLEENILYISSKLNSISDIFKETGGVHLSSLWSESELIFKYEDIGRHNSLDKMIGRILIDNVDLKDKIFFSSGRISSEIVIKCARIGINVIASRSAATNLAIELSKKHGITLIGFARGNRMTIY